MESVKSISDGLPVGIYRDNEKSTGIIKVRNAGYIGCYLIGELLGMERGQVGPLSQVTERIETTWEYPQSENLQSSVIDGGHVVSNQGIQWQEVHGKYEKR